MFSPRSGTPAAKMDGQIPEEVKKQRLLTLNEHINHWARVNNEKYQDRVVEVLCEGTSKKDDTVYSGYSRENKLVNFRSDYDPTGKIVKVRITGVKSFSLDGIALPLETE